MSGGSNIRAIGADGAPETPVETDGKAADETLALTEEYVEDTYEEPDATHRFGWVLPALAVLGIAGWTGFYVWAHQAELLAGGTPQQWSGWIIAWAIPTLLIVALWLLGMRTSRREARRFGEIANMLNAESAQLEARLGVINRELSLAREFLASQSRELESLGRVASERLSTNADTLQSLIRDNGEQVDAIASVSDTALENMTRLRDDLPVVANSARDVSNQIGNAGRTAHGQLDELVAGFERLNEFGSASERQVGSLQSRVDAAISMFETQLSDLDDLTNARFDALRTKIEEFRADLDGREVDALAGLRRRADALGEELGTARAALEEDEEEALRSMRARLSTLRDEAKQVGQSVREGEQQATEAWSAQVDALRARLIEAIEEVQKLDESALAAANRKLEALQQEAETIDRNIADRDARLFTKIAKRQSEVAQTESEAIAAFEARLAELDALLAERRGAFAAQTEQVGEQGEAVAAQVAQLREAIAEAAEQGRATEEQLAANIEALSAKLEGSRSALDGTDQAVAELTEASVRLLELLQASSEQTREQLPAALAEAEQRFGALVERAETVRAVIGEAGDMGESLSNYVAAATQSGEEAAARLEALRGQVATGNDATAERIEDLRRALATLAEQSDTLSAKAQDDLRAAIAALEESARRSVTAIGEESSGAVQAVAGRIADQAGKALDQVLRGKTEEAIAGLDEAAAKAASTSREAAIQLRDQLAKVNELAGNLETRVARAREQAEEQVDNDFARRVALITESLNSNAIDIDKTLAAEVADTEWAAYLRGDRGIFTRRAVRLLDNTDAREIAELYDADAHFRDNVARYIADFENMLRTLLSTRDGKALGVTLLSSDMGKLYVALAQAIERLRD